MNDFTNNLYRSLWPLEFWPSICRWQTFTNGANLQLCSEPFKCGWTNYKPWWYMHQTIHLKPDMMGNNACLCTETGQGCFPIWKKKPLSTESLTIHTNNTHRHWNAELLFRREQRFGWEKKKSHSINSSSTQGLRSVAPKTLSLSLFVTVPCNMITVK